MGAQILQGSLVGVSLSFSEVSFQAVLGEDLSKSVSMTLEGLKESLGWRFAITSISRSNAKSRSSTHVTGNLSLTASTDFRTYERLIASRIDALRSEPDADKLMTHRAYGLFAQVVDYAEFCHGIQDIILNETEAVANIALSKAAIIGPEESTVWERCDAIGMDAFIQVVGLLINSSNIATSGYVFVATGLEQVSISSECTFHNQRSWIVYAKYTTTGEGQAAGDIFVLTCEKRLVMIVSGAYFTKIMISKLEKVLDSANAVLVPQSTVATKEDHPRRQPQTSEMTTATMTDADLETPLGPESRSITAIHSDDGPGNPED